MWLEQGSDRTATGSDLRLQIGSVRRQVEARAIRKPMQLSNRDRMMDLEEGQRRGDRKVKRFRVYLTERKGQQHNGPVAKKRFALGDSISLHKQRRPQVGS